MPRKPPPIPLVPAPPGAEEMYEEDNIVSLQIRVADKWAEMFKNAAKKMGSGHGRYLIDIMRFAESHEKEFSEWWWATKKQELFSNMDAIGKTLEGLEQHVVYAEKLKKAKETRSKPKPKKAKK